VTTIDATSEVFMTAFRALPKKAREAVVDKMLSDKEYREELIDVALIEQRRKEPSRPLEQYLAERKRKG
jgi:tRNA A-37 threonylcarbamoyl transferase component Bud32